MINGGVKKKDSMEIKGRCSPLSYYCVTKKAVATGARSWQSSSWGHRGESM